MNMGRHIVITVYFADEGHQHDLANPEIVEHLDYYLEYPSYKEAHAAMEKRRSDAMEDIDLYMQVWNDCEAYTTEQNHGSEYAITLPKKADLDAGLLALVYHLFERGQITGFTVMHTGA
jgi:hypothetical protein